MKIHRSISEINIEQWQQLIDNSPAASFFQTPECYELYASLSFLKPFVFGVSENEKLAGLVCGYLIADGGKIKQYFSRRAIIQGGFLLCENISENALQSLLKTCINELNNKAIYIETRNCSDFSKFRATFEKNGFCYQRHLNFRIKTENIESVYAQLSSTKRRDVKISEKSGAEIVELKTKDEIAEFYAILQNLYKTKVRVPLFPLEFFEKFVSFEGNKILGIKYDGKIIGGSACTCWNNIVYEWFVCGKDGDFKSIYPSTLATWSSIVYAVESGCKYLDMLGAGKPEKDYGVRDFKAKFGGGLVEFGRFLYVCDKFRYNLGKTMIQFIKRRK